jgi:ankyrin repeat protein
MTDKNNLQNNIRSVVHKKDLKLLEEYLKENDINEVDELGWTGLHKAISIDYKKGGLYLIDKGIDTTIKDKNGDTALHFAVDNGMKEIVEAILNKNQETLNTKDKNGNNVLWMALFKARLKPEIYLPMVEILLKNGADLYSQNKVGRTPLYILEVATEPFKESIQKLIEKYKFIKH